MRRRRRTGLPDDGRLGHDALGALAGLSSHSHARPHLHLAGGRSGRGRRPVRAPQPAVRGRHVHVRPHVRPLQLRQRQGAGLSVRAHLARVPAAVPRAAAAQLAALPPAADLPRLLLQIDRRRRPANRKRPTSRSPSLPLLPALSPRLLRPPAGAGGPGGGCGRHAVRATWPFFGGLRCRRRPRGGGTSIVPPRPMFDDATPSRATPAPSRNCRDRHDAAQSAPWQKAVAVAFPDV